MSQLDRPGSICATFPDDDEVKMWELDSRKGAALTKYLNSKRNKDD